MVLGEVVELKSAEMCCGCGVKRCTGKVLANDLLR